MTRFWLIRHGSHDWLGKTMVGRQPGVTLNARGHMEAADIARALQDVPLAAIYSSPLERTQQTAEPLAEIHGLSMRTDESLVEVDFGEWTGQTFDVLASDPRWEMWNCSRAKSRAPGGESMRAVEQRIVAVLERLAREHPDADVAVISHGDVLRAALLHYQGLSLDLIHTIDLGPAAIAVLEKGQGCTRLISLSSHAALVASTHENSLFAQSANI
jgi:broad specificity phosphatase PhoE